MDPELHELNDGFAWSCASGPFETLTVEQAEHYDRKGHVVIPDAYDRDTVQAIVEEIDPIEARVAGLMARSERRRRLAIDFTVTEHLVLRSTLLNGLTRRGVLAGLARDLVGPAPRLYWEQAVYKKPMTSGAFPWHQDNGKVFVVPQQYITCWVALTDATPENGCPVFARGLHRRGTLRHWRAEQGWVCLEDPVAHEAVPVRAGSIVAFSSVTPHMTPPNRTSATRKAWVVQYGHGHAVALEPGPDGAIVRRPQDAPDRQYAVAGVDAERS
jgi:phytanoyl-CoA hydroxylase